MPLPYGYPERELLKALANINDNHFGQKIWHDLGSCMEWVANAYTLTQDISPPARYVALMTAFESLTRKGNLEDVNKLDRRMKIRCDWTQLSKTEVTVCYKKSCQPGGKLETVATQVPINKAEKFVIDYAGYRNKFVHGGQLDWGCLQHCVGAKSFDVKSVMTLVIYCLLCKQLAGDSTDEGFLYHVEQQLSAIVSALGWDSETAMAPSPHLKVDKLHCSNKDGKFIVAELVAEYKTPKREIS